MKAENKFSGGRCFCRVMCVLLAAALLCVVTSCLGVSGRIPPGFLRSKAGVLSPGIPEAASAAAVYSLLSWELEKEDWMGLPETERQMLQERRALAGRTLWKEWADEFVKQGGGLVAWQDGHLVLQGASLTRSRRTAKENFALVAALQGICGKTPQVSVVPGSQLGEWAGLGRKKSLRKAYERWAAERKRLPYPATDVVSLEKMGEQLQEFQTRLEWRQTIRARLSTWSLPAVATAEQLSAALEEWTQFSKTVPSSLALGEIGDDETLARLQNMGKTLAERCVDALLRKVEGSLPPVEGVAGLDWKILEQQEESCSQWLMRWRDDVRYQAACRKNHARLCAVAARCQALRERNWQREMDDLMQRGRYWELSQAVKQSLELSIREAVPSGKMALYLQEWPDRPEALPRSGVSRLQRDLCQWYFVRLSKVFADYLSRAEQAVNVNNQYGLALGICAMLRQMCELPVQETFPADMQAAIRRCHELESRSEKLLAQELRHSLTVLDFQAPPALAGIGVTYSRDLANGLRDLLARTGWERYVTVAKTDASSAGDGYVVRAGYVANFDGAETSEQRGMRTIQRLAPPSRKNNPRYREDAQRGPQASRFLYEQERWEHLIHSRTVTRVAHIRFSLLFSMPGGETRKMELNEFYRKAFLQEESHRFEDARKLDASVYYAEKDVPPSQEFPALVFDRCWTPGEMLDWARLDSLQVTALQILAYIRDYPLYFAEIAEHSEEPSLAADSWGKCLYFCRTLPPELNVRKLLEGRTLAARAFSDCCDYLQRQDRRLAALKEQVTARLYEALNACLVPASQTQNDGEK